MGGKVCFTIKKNVFEIFEFLPFVKNAIKMQISVRYIFEYEVLNRSSVKTKKFHKNQFLTLIKKNAAPVNTYFGKLALFNFIYFGNQLVIRTN